MGEIKRNFLQGKMNTDIDERLVEAGQSVYSLNNLIAKSEGSEVGAIENSLGNEKKTFLNLTNATTIGVFQDDSYQQIYYFVTADEKDLVLEYEDHTESLAVLLESTRVDGKTTLNFQTDKLITGVVRIINGTGEGDLLGWTDDNEAPRLINIERAKTYGADGFTEDDISLIKKPPIFPPDLDLTFADHKDRSGINDKFISFCYAWKYLDGQVSAISPFSEAAFSPRQFSFDPHTSENNGMQNSFSAVNINFETGEKQVTDVILGFKEAGSDNIYIIDVFNKKNNEWGDNQTKSFKFSDIKIYGVMPENELYHLFDAVPRRAKAMDVIGNRIALANYLEGYDLIDKYGEKLKIDFNLSLFTKNLAGETIPYELATSVTENDFIELDFSGIDLVQDSRITLNFIIQDSGANAGSYNGSFDFILNRSYADAVDLASDNSFKTYIEEVFTNDFLENFLLTPPDSNELSSHEKFLIDSSSPISIVIKAPTLTYSDGQPTPSYTKILWKFLPTSEAQYKTVAIDSSCKTNRSYEVAQIYLDEHGRSTTALTAPNNTLYIPQENSVVQNKIRVNVNHRPPEWAKYFRFAVKQNKKLYQNIFVSIFYEDGIYRWIKLDGANKDKVKEGDTLIVKSDLSGAVSDVIKVRVLEIKSFEKDFLQDNVDELGEPIIEKAGLYMKIKAGEFDTNYSGDTFKTFAPKLIKRKKSIPTLPFGALGYYSADNTYTDYPVNAGTQIKITVRNWVEDSRYWGLSDKGEDYRYTKTFIVNGNYDNFELWFNAEVQELVQGEGSDYKRWEHSFTRTAEGELYFNVKGHIHGSTLTPSKIDGEIYLRFTEGIIAFETEPEDDLSDIYYEIGTTYNIQDGYHLGNIQEQDFLNPAIIELDFFNCFVQGDGIESYRYKDALNKKFLNIDTRPTTDSSKEYKEIHRYADITYSEPFIESLGINGLSTFNLANANYKDDIVKKYGSIQKILARENNLLVMQEDKISQVLYGKELIVEADGANNISGVDKVLGTQVMYAGEHGISRNPESFARSGNRIYFTDEKRNQVCRLSIDGITVISDYGMTAHFRDLFTRNMNKAKFGAFDPYTGKYTLTASDQIIYNPVTKIDCKNSITKSNFSGTLLLEVDYGLSIGDAGFTINVTNGETVNYSVLYDGISQTGATSGLESVTFDKSSILPRKAYIQIDAAQPSNFEISGNCVIVQQFTVVSIVFGNSQNEGEIIDNRYKWLNGDFSSSFKHFETIFKKDGVSIWNSETGDEGSPAIPITDSILLMQSYRGYNHTGAFGDEDSMKYLISDTAYTEADVQTVVDLANELTPTVEETEGGERIVSAMFSVARPAQEQYLYLIWDYSGLSININTNIYIYFDSSGSMDTTLAPLQEMRDTVLKDALLPLYDFDEAAYNDKVRVIENGSERTIDMLNFLNQTPEGNVISLVFQDETENQGYMSSDQNWTIYYDRKGNYNTDIATFRSRLNSFPANYYRGIVFQVATGTTSIYAKFKDLLQAIQTGQGNYTGVNGLSDRPEVAFKYDTTPAASPQYYKDLIVNALRELGYSL